MLSKLRLSRETLTTLGSEAVEAVQGGNDEMAYDTNFGGHSLPEASNCPRCYPSLRVCPTQPVCR